MDALIITISIILLIIGMVSSVLPPFPGPPIAFCALLLSHFCLESEPFSTTLLIVLGITSIASTWLDNLAAVWGTKKFGGTKAGVRGSFIGLLVSVFLLGPIPFLGPIATILLGPFVGAVIGELLAGQEKKTALKSGVGSFLGFLMGIGLKLALTLMMFVYFLKAII